jgi:hypothetical protein
MSLVEELEREYLKAYKNQDKLTVSVLRILRAYLKNKQVEQRGKLEEADSLAVLRGLIRQGKESIEQFSKGGRQDLVEKEKAELEVLSAFLPTQAPVEEIDQIIEQVIREVKAVTLKDMGKVMKPVMTRLAGRADGQMIQAKVKEKLSQG